MQRPPAPKTGYWPSTSYSTCVCCCTKVWIKKQKNRPYFICNYSEVVNVLCDIWTVVGSCSPMRRILRDYWAAQRNWRCWEQWKCCFSFTCPHLSNLLVDTRAWGTCVVQLHRQASQSNHKSNGFECLHCSMSRSSTTATVGGDCTIHHSSTTTGTVYCIVVACELFCFHYAE